MEQPVKMANGKWRARIYKEGKRLSLGVYETRKEASEAMAKALVEDSTEARGHVLFWKYAEAHIRVRREDLAEGSWDNYIRSYNKYLAPEFGKLKLKDVTATRVKTWWTRMAPNPGPRRAAYMVLSNIMRAAVLEGEIAKTPCVVPKASREVSTPRPTFTKDAVAFVRMFAADSQVSTMLWVLVSTGLRISEVLPLMWEDIDLEAGTIRVNKHLTRFDIMPGRKSHPEADILQPFAGAAVEALEALKASRDTKTGPAFLDSFGEAMSYHAWFSRWDTLRKEANMPNLRTHDIRSVHLTAFGEKSSLKEVMERGGHGDVRSALRYQRPDPERQKQIVAQLTF